MTGGKPCKIIDCSRPRFANQSICATHYWERQRLNREEKARKKLERKIKTKKYQESELKKWRNKLDETFSLLIRKAGRCARCGRTPPNIQLQCSHLYSRRYMAIRWDTENAVAKCAGCHIWWGNNPVEAYEWLISSGVRTKEQMDELRRKANTVKQWTAKEMESLCSTFLEEL